MGSAAAPSRLRRLFELAQSQHGLRGAHQDVVPAWMGAWSNPRAALTLLRHARASHSVPFTWAPVGFTADAHDPAYTAAATKNPDHDAPSRAGMLPPVPQDPPILGLGRDNAAPVSFLLNAAFLHETSLFFLLLNHPLPSSTRSSLNRISDRELPAPVRSPTQGPVSGGGGDGEAALQASLHYVFSGGHWCSYPAESIAETWLSAAMPAIDVQLAHGAQTMKRGPEETEVAAETTHSDTATERLSSGDYLEHLIWPPTAAGALRPELTADRAWVEAAMVRAHALRCYGDAFWVPYSSTQRFFDLHQSVLKSTVHLRVIRDLEAWRAAMGDLYLYSSPHRISGLLYA